MSFVLRLYHNELFWSENVCTAVSIQKEIYSPLSTMSAVFLPAKHYGPCQQGGTLFSGESRFSGVLSKNGTLFSKRS